MQIASGTVSQSKAYILQARTNSDGRITVRQDEVVIGQDKTVKAGEMFTQPAVLKDKSTFEIRFTPATGAETLTQTLTVEQSPHVTGNRNGGLAAGFRLRYQTRPARRANCISRRRLPANDHSCQRQRPEGQNQNAKSRRKSGDSRAAAGCQLLAYRWD